MDYIDIYCERLEPGFWAEPINAVTNAAFLVAAFLAWRISPRDFGVRVLSTVMVMIGLGSFLFHTFATYATMMMDVVPILLFQIAFIWLYGLRVMRLGTPKTFGIFVAFMAASVMADAAPREWLNGSLGYAPALLFLLGFSLWHYRSMTQERSILLLAAGVFVASLTFRTLDRDLCESFALGTHFLWHCLNAVVLYLCVRGYVGGRSK